MPKILGVREMTNEESTTLDRLSRWQTAPARQVERAKMVQWVKDGQRVPEVAQQDTPQ